jgi:hypothetical protein
VSYSSNRRNALPSRSRTAHLARVRAASGIDMKALRSHDDIVTVIALLEDLRFAGVN